MKRNFLICLSFVILAISSESFAAQSATELFERARVLYGQGRYAHAEILFRKAEVRGAPPFEAAFDIANCLFQQEKYPEAAAAYRKAFDASEGKSSASLFNLGAVLFRIGQYPESVAAYRRALDIDPSNASGWVFLGEASSRSGDKVGALRAFSKALEITPDDIGVIYNAAEAEIALGNPEAAVKRAREAYGHHPEEIDFLVYAGDVERSRKKFTEAAALYREALSAKPDSKDVMYKLADALSESGNPFAAMDELSAILAIDSTDGDAAIFLGNLAFDAHWMERSEKAYATAAAAGNAEALYGFRNLIYEYESGKNFRDALRIWNMAKKFYPNDKSLAADGERIQENANEN